MTPAARVQTAIEVLDEILSGAPAEKTLTGWARRSRFAGSKDRAAVRDHVYDALRRRRSALPDGLEESGRALMLGLLRQDGAPLEALFSAGAYGPTPLEVHEVDAVAGDMELAVDLPDWIVPLWQAALREKFEENVQALKHRAPVFLRVNLQKATRDAAIDQLAIDSVVCEVSPLADSALLVTEGARKVAQSQAYRNGLVELQDASSQAAVASLALRDGMRVLDFCAGGGGKTLAIAGRVDAELVAHDAIVKRMRDLPQRAERAGVNVALADAAQLKTETPFDLVFCDVPCSGSGTWRRTPDAKWRFDEADLTDLTRVQSQILREAAAHVKPGGHLIFATCSVLCEENEDQIEAFLADHREFSCDSLQRWSMSEGSDGFFLAQMARQS